MNIFVFETSLEASQYAYDLVAKALESGANTFGLATGSTPEELYSIIRDSDLDFTDAKAVNLDEYYGLPADNDQSYAYFMKKHLFDAKPFAQTHIPNGTATDVEKEIEDYNTILSENPVDLQILGIGSNGHIGFNEPGSPFDSKTRLVDLTDETIQANKRNFESEADVPKKAFSMGIGSILESKQIVLMAFGENKAKAVKETVHGEVTPDVPASVLKNHSNTVILLDKAAASQLDPSDYEVIS
ncbi:glucosamine-6-phosphate deaminase [Ruoffia tabacinasalis]|jgi:glucosamine-6-phosphate deaminase|uniref:glucosamine-6-phosphate deaminase n=1 Tax=Ruoffia tabacinasalis TaxID=87458 RepID=UPI0030CB7C63